MKLQLQTTLSGLHCVVCTLLLSSPEIYCLPSMTMVWPCLHWLLCYRLWYTHAVGNCRSHCCPRC